MGVIEGESHSRPQGRVLLAAALVVQVALLCALVRPWRDLAIAEAPVIPATQAPVLPLTIENGAEVAAGYARTWRADARLVAATERISWTNTTPGNETTVPGDGWITYVFVSGHEALSLSLSRTRAVPFGRQVGPWGGPNWPLLDLATYPKSSTMAVLTAEVLGGQAFRNACLVDRQAAIVTPSLFDGKPVWTVTYRDDRSPGSNPIIVRVDATTGDVLTKAISNPPCDGG